MSPRTRTMQALSPEQLRAVSDGRAQVTRSGRLVVTAPRATTYSSRSYGMDDNPNRGKRNARRLPEAAPTYETQPYRPLQVSWPTTDSRGRRNPRIIGNIERGRNGYTV